MALAIYRKYRPEAFAEVVGQEHVTTQLVNAVDGGRINHAYLFSGPRGCGKTSSARILARSLNCERGPAHLVALRVRGLGVLGAAVRDRLEDLLGGEQPPPPAQVGVDQDPPHAGQRLVGRPPR